MVVGQRLVGCNVAIADIFKVASLLPIFGSERHR